MNGPHPLVLMLSLGLAAHAAAAAERTIAVLPVGGDGVDEADLGRVVGQLHDELRRLPDVEVRKLEGTGTMAGVPTCLHDDLPCLTALGRHLGVSHVVSGLVTPRDDGLFVVLHAVDTRAEARSSTVELELVTDGRSSWGPQVREAVTRLLSPHLLTGVLVVSVDTVGASVLIDGVPQGTSPLDDPIAGLSPGRHELEVRLDGHPSVRRFVTVSFGEVTSERVTFADGGGDEVDARAEDPAPADGPNLVLAAVGGGVAAGGLLLLAGGVATVWGATAAFGSVPPSGSPAEREELAREALQNLSLFSAAGYGLAGAGAVVTLVGAGMVGASFLVE